VLAIAIQLHALAAAQRFAFTAVKRRFPGSLADAQARGVALVPRQALAVAVAREPVEPVRQGALTADESEHDQEAACGSYYR
jgi:hypothetical protein